MAPAIDRVRPHCGLLLAAHGERGEGASNDGVADLAAALARRNIAAEVRVGFIKGEPGIGAALRGFTMPEILVYPLLLSDGYFTRVRLGQVLAQIRSTAGRRTITTLPPLGLDPGLAGLVGEKAAAAAQSRGFGCERTALGLIAHGSTSDSASRRAAQLLAGRLDALRRFARVFTAFLEEPPSLSEALAHICGPTVVVGLVAGEGLHGRGDIRRLIGGLQRSNLAFAGNVGGWPELADVVAAAVTRVDAAPAPRAACAIASSSAKNP